MTVMSFRVGHLTTPDAISIEVRGWGCSHSQELGFGQFEKLIRAGELIRVDGEQQHP